MRYDDAAQAREREHAAVEHEKSSAWEEAMALIEHLQRDGWEEFLRDIFEYTLDVPEERPLQTNHRQAGASPATELSLGA